MHLGWQVLLVEDIDEALKKLREVENVDELKMLWQQYGFLVEDVDNEVKRLWKEVHVEQFLEAENLERPFRLFATFVIIAVLYAVWLTLSMIASQLVTP